VIWHVQDKPMPNRLNHDAAVTSRRAFRHVAGIMQQVSCIICQALHAAVTAAIIATIAEVVIDWL